MPNPQLEKLVKNFELLKKEGVVETRFYVGEISETTSEQFAAEANIILDAFIAGRVKRVEWSCSSIN